MSNQQMITRSVKVFSTRGQQEYTGGDIIEIKVSPSQVQLLNPYNTFLKFTFECKLNGGTPFFQSASDRIGAIACIRNLTIKDGTGQTIISQIREYSQLKAVIKEFEKNDSIANLNKLMEGVSKYKKDTGIETGSNTNSGGGLKSAYYNSPPNLVAQTTFLGYKPIEIKCGLELSGVLGKGKGLKLFPIIASRGLIIEIELESNIDKVLSLNGIESGKVAPDEIIGYTNGAGYELYGYVDNLGAVQAGNIANGTNITGVVLKKTVDAGRHITNHYLDQGTVGSFIDSPWCVGQRLRMNNSPDGTGANFNLITPITSIESATDRVVLKFALTATNVPFGAGSKIHIDLANSNMASSYSVRNVELLCSSVQANPQYLSSLNGAMGKGITMGFKDWENYPLNIPIGNVNNSLYIPAKNERALSVMTVMQDTSVKIPAERRIGDGLKPHVGSPNNYVWLINGVLSPNKNVDLNRVNTGGQFGAVQQMEVVSSLENCDIMVRNIKNQQTDNFTIQRNLSRHGHSYNLAEASELRLNLTYNTQPKALLSQNYVCHYRTINISNQGVAVIK